VLFETVFIQRKSESSGGKVLFSALRLSRKYSVRLTPSRELALPPEPAGPVFETWCRLSVAAEAVSPELNGMVVKFKCSKAVMFLVVGQSVIAATLS
jgi:hypothetical protein